MPEFGIAIFFYFRHSNRCSGPIGIVDHSFLLDYGSKAHLLKVICKG